MLAEVGDFFVEVGQGSFQGFFVVRVGSGFEVVGYADAGELKVFAGLFVVYLFGGLSVGRGFSGGFFEFFYL